MKCPNCGVLMNLARSPVSKLAENICPNCGLKRPAKAQVKADTISDPIPFSAPDFAQTGPASKSKKNTTASKSRKQMEKAHHLTDLRQVAKELASRVGDLEIQVSRRLEDLQAISVRLAQLIENYED